MGRSVCGTCLGVSTTYILHMVPLKSQGESNLCGSHCSHILNELTSKHLFHTLYLSYVVGPFKKIRSRHVLSSRYDVAMMSLNVV